MEVCTNPTVFPQAPEVCGTCGNLLENHRTRPASEIAMKKDMWKVLLAKGGTWNYYGGYFEGPHSSTQCGKVYRNEMASLLWHLENCEINWHSTTLPEMETNYEFAGTSCESARHTVMAGRLYCTCGKLCYEQVGINDMTVGQLIWHVAHAGDEGEK